MLTSQIPEGSPRNNWHQKILRLIKNDDARWREVIDKNELWESGVKCVKPNKGIAGHSQLTKSQKWLNKEKETPAHVCRMPRSVKSHNQPAFWLSSAKAIEMAKSCRFLLLSDLCSFYLLKSCRRSYVLLIWLHALPPNWSSTFIALSILGDCKERWYFLL